MTTGRYKCYNDLQEAPRTGSNQNNWRLVELPMWLSGGCRRLNSSLHMALFLPPANEVWGKVIFLHLSVILFTGGSVPGQVHPQAGTPPAGNPGQVHPSGQVHPPAGTPLGKYTPKAGTPLAGPPGRYTPQQCMLGYGQQAGGTHPTGMHSCK